MGELEDSGAIGRRRDWWKRSAFPVLLAALIGAVGGGPGYRALQDPREHPYTSLDARQDKAAVLIRLDAITVKHESRMDRIELRANTFADELATKPPQELIERVVRLERDCEWMQKAMRIFKSWPSSKIQKEFYNGTNQGKH